MKKICVIVAALVLAAAARASEPLRIWFDVPTWSGGKAIWTGGTDNEWESKSLPIGNGSLGANVMGSISCERLTLNEKSLWTGGPAVTDDPSYYWDCNRPAAALLPEIRQAFLDGDGAKAEELTKKNFGAVPERIVDGKKVDSYKADINDWGDFTGETEVIKDGEFEESVYRSAPAFDLNIDGITIIDN